jgi:hypothetical protein
MLAMILPFYRKLFQNQIQNKLFNLDDFYLANALIFNARFGVRLTVGSNPTPSAPRKYGRFGPSGVQLRTGLRTNPAAFVHAQGGLPGDSQGENEP